MLCLILGRLFSIPGNTIVMTEWNASDYAQHSSLQEAMAAKALSSLVLEGVESVVDVGCGDGKITAAIAQRLPRGEIVGVDPSRDMIAFAAGRYATANYPNLRFEEGDVLRLGYCKEFDLAVSFNALHWVVDQEEAVRSLHDALRQGGKALLRFVGEGPRASIEDMVETVRKSARWQPFFSGFQKPFAHPAPDAFRRLAERIGFHVHQLGVEDIKWNYPGPDGFRDFCRVGLVEWTRRLPKTEWKPFIEEVLECYRKTTGVGLQEFRFYQLQAELEVGV
jgi:trans-aconitate methyltransferase